MGEVPLSLHVSAETKRNLEREAALTRQSESEIAGEALEAYFRNREHLREALNEAIAEADKGVFISGEAMHRWIESWGTENELPPPEPDVFPPPRK